MSMRVALAGIGHWHAPLHLDAVRAAGADVARVWDPDPAVTSRFAADAGAAAASELAALLADRPDLVVVMGHPTRTPDTARACLAAGVPIVLEKPAASSTEALAAVAPGPDRFVAVPFANRCSPLWAELGRLRDAGKLGTLAHAHFRVVNGPPGRYRADGVPWLLDPAIGGGGALRNLGLHGVDAALALLGDAAVPSIVGAAVRNTAHAEAVEDYAVATLGVPGGPVITVEAGYTYASMAAGGDFEWRVAAAGATLIDRGDACSVATLDDGVRRVLDPLPAGARYRAFMADTLGRLRSGAAPLAGFDDYLRAMRVVDRIYQEAAQGTAR